MKNPVAVICLSSLIAVLGLQYASGKDAPTSAEQLRSEFEAALKAKDAKAILSLHCWKSVSPEMKSSEEEMISELVKETVKTVKLLPLPAEYKPTNEVDCIYYFPNVHVQGSLNVESTEKGEVFQIRYGEDAGKFYIAGVVQETIDPHPKPPKILSVHVEVTGSGLPDSGKFTGSYVYIRCGREIKKAIHGVGNLTQTFGADYIKSCTAQKNPDNRDKHERIQLVVSEDNKMIFDSGKIETNAPIAYEKKN